MNSTRIKDRIKTMFPCKWNDDFIKSIGSLFDSYRHFLSEEGCQTDILEEIDETCNKIIDSVSSIFEGCHGDAFNTFSCLMNCPLNCHSSSSGILSLSNSIQIHESEYWYRARNGEEGKEFSVLDLFHIPLDKRGIVGTQRFSCPGYPCLYLSRSTYGCWEELGRPVFDTLFYSSFRVRNSFRLLDLRIPDVDNCDDSQLIKTLKLLPLIIACSFSVNNPKDVFKPEYTIPQLLLETIIHNNHNKTKVEKTYLDEDIIWGILYSSSHINNGFSFDSQCLDNIVMPIIETQNKNNYCSYLASTFDISIPTCYEYELIKDPLLKRQSFTSSSSTPYEDSIHSYQKTKMVYLEDIMRTAEYISLNHLVPFAPKEGVVLDPDGSPVEVPIRSNGPFTIV